MTTATSPSSSFCSKVINIDNRNFLIQVLKFDNGNFVSVAEGSAKLGGMVASLGSNPYPVTTTVIPTKIDSFFLKLVAERVSTITKGITIVSTNLQKEIDSNISKYIMDEIMVMIRNV